MSIDLCIYSVDSTASLDGIKGIRCWRSDNGEGVQRDDVRGTVDDLILSVNLMSEMRCGTGPLHFFPKLRPHQRLLSSDFLSMFSRN